MQGVRTCMYNMSREMSDAVGLKKELYWDATKLLNDTNLLTQSIAKGIRGKGTNGSTAAVVLNHVLQRTLPFHKLVEYITAEEVANGKDSLGLPASAISKATAKRGLNVLVQEGYLIRLTTSLDKGRVYGLNLPLIVRKVREYLDSGKIKEGTTADKQRRRCIQVEQICNQLQPWYDHLKEIDELALYKLDRILADLKAWCRRNLNLMGTAKQMIKSGQEKAQEAKVWRLRKAAEKPLINADGEEKRAVR